MDWKYLKDMSPEARREELEANCEEFYKGNFHRTFSPTEKNMKRARYAELDIQLEVYNDELTQAKEAHKLKSKPLMDEKKKLLEEIRSNGENVNGTVYKFINCEEKLVTIISEEGDVIEERKLTNADKQRRLKFEVSRTGTED